MCKRARAWGSIAAPGPATRKSNIKAKCHYMKVTEPIQRRLISSDSIMVTPGLAANACANMHSATARVETAR